uniref:Protease n=2 Tax=Anthurium amnicola TaxID=1678845 RepID=A0A1D1YP20_9ARAE
MSTSHGREMMSALSSYHCTFLLPAYENHLKRRSSKDFCLGYSGLGFHYGGASYAQRQFLVSFSGKVVQNRLVIARGISDNKEPGDPENGDQDKGSPSGKSEEVNNGSSRDDLERLVGKDDASFSGVDLATLIRKKYGRSYDVQLIKKEFMGRNLLAMNVMWKYMEQRSFPLSEEEYLLRLDDVANMLKCWGAVSHVRNSLERLKERPRIGKAVSIFIDMDESGGRSNEWIYK